MPVLGLALVAAAVAYPAGIAAARRLGARVASFVGLAEVLFAVLFAWLLLDQRPSLLQGVGGVVVLVGIALVRADEPALADEGAARRAAGGGRAPYPTSSRRLTVDADLDTLATALYVRVDDLLKAYPERVPWRPRVGITPRVTDAEMVTLSVMAALLGYSSEARWLRFAGAHLRHLFTYLPQQSGYNKRLRKLTGTISWLIRALGRDTSVFTDDVWLADSTPVECARSRETVKRSDLAGFAEYGYCASHSRYFWGLRLHLVCTLSGLPIGAALTGAKADERHVLLDILDDPDLAEHRHAQMVIADKNYFGREFEATLATAGIDLLRPARKGENERPGARFFKPLRQVIESINDTFKGQLNLEQHGGRSITGVTVRVWQRVLALTAAIWHNDHIGTPVKRSLTAYDH